MSSDESDFKVFLEKELHSIEVDADSEDLIEICAHIARPSVLAIMHKCIYNDVPL